MSREAFPFDSIQPPDASAGVESPNPQHESRQRQLNKSKYLLRELAELEDHIVRVGGVAHGIGPAEEHLPAGQGKGAEKIE